MKKLTLLLLIALYFSLNIKAQDTVRIYQLDQQNTVDTNLVFMADKSTLDSSRSVKWSLLSPRMKDLTLSTGTLNKSLTYLEILDDGTSYTSKKAQLSDINPSIEDFGTKIGGVSSTDYFLVSSSSVEKKAPISYITTEVAGSSALQTAVNADIDARVDSSFIIVLIAETYIGYDLDVSADRKGILYIQRIGNMVSGSLAYPKSTGDAWLTVDGGDFASGTLPNNLRPRTTGYSNDFVEFSNNSVDDFFQIRFYANGTIQVRCHGTDAPHIGFSYWSQN